MKGWKDVFVKELREFARDRRVLNSALLGPLFLEVFLIFIFGYLATSLGSKERKDDVLVYNGKQGAKVVEALEATGRFRFATLEDLARKDEVLKEGKTKLVLSFPDDFAAKLAAKKAPEFTAYYDPNTERSQMALSVVKEVISAARAVIRERRMVERNLDPKEFEAFAVKEEKAHTGKPFAGMMLVGFLPYLIVIWAFYGGFSIVSDLVAGEKERGTLETLLVSPISRNAIAFGKFMALASLSLTSCLSALLGVVLMGALNLPMTKAVFENGLHISPLAVFAIVLALLPLVVCFAGVLLAISTYAKNQREVAGYLSLASFVVLIPAVISQFIGYTDAANAKWIAFVPVLNVATVIREALLDKVNLYNLLVTAGFMSLLAAIGLSYAIRLFHKESVLLRV